MKQDALPFWAEAGLNTRTGLFHERLNQDGQPDWQVPLRIRVQFRQIYVFSHAAVLGWFPEGAAIALSAWRHLLRLAYESNGEPGFAHLLSADGSVVDARRDSYDHAFAVLAAAWLLKATDEPSIRRVLERLLTFVDEHLTDAFGALRDLDADGIPNRQNPQMHWFEAMLALVETGMHTSGEERSRRHRRFAEEHLFDAENGMLGEYYSSDWKPYPGQLGQIVEPGHFFEWIWLLHRHESLTGHEANGCAARLMQAGRGFICNKSGLLVDEGCRKGSVKRGGRRIWLQTELLKAHLARFEAGNTESRHDVWGCLASLDRHYLRKPFAQGWIDQLDEHARPVDSPVPAGILYHLFVALSEIERVALLPSMSAGGKLQRVAAAASPKNRTSL
jgi:mannose-6-phosphate isomerase